MQSMGQKARRDRGKAYRDQCKAAMMEKRKKAIKEST